MTRTTRFARFAFFLLPLAFFLLALAAAPPRADTPDEVVRRANEALRAGNVEEANELYAAAEERTTDPGLVAFDRAAVLFEQKNYREAERHYDRVLEDASCPPERAARAWYNRGTCLLNRGGSIDVYRAAIACFENALDVPAADQEVRDRAPHNLELAKLHWNEERKKAAKPEEESPNKKPPHEEDKQPRPEPDKSQGGSDGGAEDAGSTAAQKAGQPPQPVPQPKGDARPGPMEHTAPAPNPNLQAPEDKDEVQKLSPEEAREYMKETAKRRKRELHSLLETLYGPERAGARDR
ncbi:MAG: tetratricopeptide repeat protein [Planctomycetes bacterium]|nr:tetratricopeptide repeat protein [Planctomycetota bacterium]